MTIKSKLITSTCTSALCRLHSHPQYSISPINDETIESLLFTIKKIEGLLFLMKYFSNKDQKVRLTK
jgi:hypothetical protein